MINHGVILGQRDTDYIAGTLPYEIVNPTGDWTPYLPLGEYQRLPSYSFDTMACVTFSALNIIETLYFFNTGVRRNFSDRFTARMSGTTQDGNWQWKVADSIRKAGIVDEELWPAPTSPSTTWGEYYSVPTIEVVNKALEFKNDWEVTYEFIDFTRESLLYHLKQAPIQVIIPGHAVMNFLTTDQVYKYFDSYSPFVKERVEPFVYAMKLILTKKSMAKFVKVEGEEDVWSVLNGKRSLVYNALAFNLVSADWASIKTITQAELIAIPDTGKVIAGLDQE